ncbi:hypothetical protein [Phenylobacterium sp.]|jgi:hypothetical protein|uniref:hypothetical protein n=1 Tax=Phenylobacterium sp. TaxID=1871053 RepID=UPI002F4219A4
MIALLLATQLSAQTLAAPPAAPQPSILRPSSELIRILPGARTCMDNPPGHTEVSLKATPTALYRQGDRPAKGLRKWADYPDGTLCNVEAGR